MWGMMLCMRRLLFLCLGGLLLFALVRMPDAAADVGGDGGLNVVRDAEIESYIAEITKPIFAAAGLGDQHIQIVLVDSSDLNAFVSGGQNIFIYTGLLMAATDPQQLYGVIAHETGHIAGGHLVRGAAAMRTARNQAMLGTLVGIAAGVATGNPGAGMAMITGGNDVATRSFLAFSREQESGADNAGLTFMNRAKLDPHGLVEFLETLEGQELLPPERQAAFVRTHPLTRDRIDALKGRMEQADAPYDPVPEAWLEAHRRMQGKLLGFTDPMGALTKYPASDSSFAAQYARSIAYFKRGQLMQALPILDGLIKREPNNAYLYELRGQMLFENSRVAESIPLYKQALQLVPAGSSGKAILETEYGHALVEEGNKADLPQAIDTLRDAAALEDDSPLTWRLLATAWGRQGKEGLSSYALAEAAAASGDVKLARLQAAKAERLLPAGSPELLRLIDLRGNLDQMEQEQKDARFTLSASGSGAADTGTTASQ